MTTMIHAFSCAWSRQLLSTRPNHPNWMSVILWWEIRRIPYNIIVGVVGVASLVAFELLIAASGVLQTGEDAVEPMAILAAPFAFNLCYTAGWVVELLVRWAPHDDQASVGPLLFGAGLALSLAIVLTPTVIWGAYDLVKWSRIALTGA